MRIKEFILYGLNTNKKMERTLADHIQRLFAPLPPNTHPRIIHMVGYHCPGLRKSTLGQK